MVNLEIDNEIVDKIFSRHKTNILRFTEIIVTNPSYTLYQSFIVSFIDKYLAELILELIDVIKDKIITNLQNLLDYLDNTVYENCLIYSLKRKGFPFHFNIPCDENVRNQVTMFSQNEDKYLDLIIDDIIELLTNFIQRNSLSYSRTDFQVYKSGIISLTIRSNLRIRIKENSYREFVKTCGKLQNVDLKQNAKFNDTLYILREYTLEKIKEIISSEAYNLYREI
ncbi:MAG: hypothetical protein QW806_09085 [Nitrososphaerota archaeon]